MGEEAGDTYRTLAAPSRAETKVKGSRFLAEAFPVESGVAAEEKITEVRRREHKATHHCTAYRTGPRGQTFRYDDDGEPSGTAGPPILKQIDGHGLTNTLVVVTRYFGGTKLGTGGLVSAYGGAASDALEAARLCTRVLRVPLRLRFAYDDTAPATRVIEQFEAAVLEAQYTAETELTVGVRRSEAERFLKVFMNALGARGAAERLQGEES